MTTPRRVDWRDPGSVIVGHHQEGSASNIPVIVTNPVRSPTAFVRTLDQARIDQLVALVFALSIVLQIWLSPSVSDRWAATVAGLVLSTAVGMRRRWPLGCLVVGMGAVSAEAPLGGAVAQHAAVAIPAAVMCFYGAGAFLERRRSRLALAVGFAALLPQILLTPHVGSDLFFELVVLGLAPWAAGRFLRQRSQEVHRYRELSERLDTEDHHAVISATREERTRIAGELHDVIGHCLSVIVLQAGGARMLVRSDPDRAGAALQVVQQAGHDALIELRRLLTVLGDTSLPAETGPLPGIDDLAPLVARTTGTALRVDLEVEGTTRPVSASVGLCAYRIVQEALTNVIKHADAARAKVSLAWAPDALELEIADDGHGLATFRAEGVGRGLIGMRERVAVLDGSLHTGSSVRGGFVVHASLPLAEELA